MEKERDQSRVGERRGMDCYFRPSVWGSRPPPGGGVHIDLVEPWAEHFWQRHRNREKDGRSPRGKRRSQGWVTVSQKEAVCGWRGRWPWQGVWDPFLVQRGGFSRTRHLIGSQPSAACGQWIVGASVEQGACHAGDRPRSGHQLRAHAVSLPSLCVLQGQ